ncbi:MAG: bifunctional diaminohydroxyphosphoribosylaminopyrimidine deaminase/5-amino-6-(5-phosphoribosylamino)uracil reductase RibD [Deltaproteobacteria bacterium]|nr:bifunctional diaminohydroxyphosphoribosylaminopyrimidine deaminase/5-amino-6-(5-phosphoribosylamino)uracil reductase RibD [Deltaproteobacteria bacterium]
MDHERFMRLALKLAARGAGKTSPNPAVGSVIVKNGRVIAEGYHKKAGGPHAEAAALATLKNGAKDATLYVTLEPCCHFGRTPPCTDAIINSGIKKVVIGTVDPNPKVSGKGISLLKAAGVLVASGVLERECRKLNEAYNRYMTGKVPFVTLKLAQTLDARTAAAGGESKWITGEASRALVHRMRSRADAVMVGSSTVLKDDPMLNVRHVGGKNPLKVVLDSTLKTPLTARVFKGGGLLIFTTRAALPSKIRKAVSAGAEVIVVPASKDGIDLKRVLRELKKREVVSVLAEAGGTLAASLLRGGLVDKLSVFISPTVIGSEGFPAVGPLGVKMLKDALRLTDTTVKRAGTDILVEGYVRK